MHTDHCSRLSQSTSASWTRIHRVCIHDAQPIANVHGFDVSIEREDRDLSRWHLCIDVRTVDNTKDIDAQLPVFPKAAMQIPYARAELLEGGERSSTPFGSASRFCFF